MLGDLDEVLLVVHIELRLRMIKTISPWKISLPNQSSQPSGFVCDSKVEVCIKYFILLEKLRHTHHA